MIFESPELLNVEIKEKLNWVFTRFILFEVERMQTTLPKTEIGKIDRLIAFHEELENYEICHKLLIYKQRIKNV
jgi:hypothetical protein